MQACAETAAGDAAAVRTGWQGKALCLQWKLRWQRWQDDPDRRAFNELCIPADLVACRVTSRMLLLFLLTKPTWQERLFGLALQGATHCLVAEALIYLILHRRATYLKHRELFLTGATWHITWAVKQLVLNGGLNIYRLHAGSPLLLLLLMQICHALWMCLYMVHHRLPVKWNWVALPLLSLLPLWNSTPVCHRVLDAPGVQEPLSVLYTLLGLTHSTVASPAALAPMWDSCTPFQQCLVVNAWSVLVFGGVLPLVVARQLDSGTHRLRVRAQQRREQQQERLQEPQWQEQLVQSQVEDQEQAARHPGASLAELVLGSCLVWVITIVAVLTFFPAES